MAKSMRELQARKQVKIVKRYIDTFNQAELADIAQYVEAKAFGAPKATEHPQFVLDLAKDNDAKVEKRDGAFWIVKGGKEIYRVAENGDVTKPKGKKVLDNIFKKAVKLEAFMKSK